MADRHRSFPDLPILDELGEDLHRAARRADERERSAPSRGAGRIRARVDRRLRWPSIRLALVATAAMVLVVLPVVVVVRAGNDPAERDAAQGGRAAATAASGGEVVLASGTGPDEAWQLSARGGSCVALEIGGESRAYAGCDGRGDPDSAASGAEDRSAPQLEAADPAQIDVSVTNGSRDGFVFGRVSETAARVRVTVGEHTPVTVPSRRAIDRRGGAELEGKVFVAALDDRIALDARVKVAALDAQGRVVARSRFMRPP